MHFTYNDLIQSFCCCLGIYMYFHSMKSQFMGNERHLSWTISLLSSFVLSVSGTFQACKFLLGFEGFTLDEVYNENGYDRFLAIFFFCVNFMDFCIGFVYFPNAMPFLTTYVHHFFYMLFMAMLMGAKVTHGFQYGFFEEIPTFVLALGILYPSLRSDIMFGLTFFVTRIVWHIFITYKFFAINYHSWFWMMSAVAITMHVAWMYKWCISMRKRALRKGKPRNVKQL